MNSPFRIGTSSSLERACRRRTAPIALGLAFAACGDGGTGPTAVRVNLSPDEALLVRVAETQDFVAVAVDASGNKVREPPVWSVSDPDVVAVVSGGVVTAVGSGTAFVSASVGGATGTARVEVYLPEKVETYQPGKSYWGRQGYAEYVPGSLPLILSAGHGGDLRPGEIPTRTYGTTRADLNTRQLTFEVRDAFLDLYGFAPHVVISHLHRSRLDPNREIVEAAQGNIYAEHAYGEYHEMIRVARRRVELDSGSGLYIDMHGHSHAIQRLELGYLLTAEELNGSDASLDQLAVVARSSIRDLGRDSELPFSALLRGPTSLGGYLTAEGVAAVPGPADPGPGPHPYWRGGYSTRLHGSAEDGEVVSGVQFEHHWDGMRDTPESRSAYAPRFARSVRSFMLTHYGFFEPSQLGEPPTDEPSPGA